MRRILPPAVRAALLLSALSLAACPEPTLAPGDDAGAGSRYDAAPFDVLGVDAQGLDQGTGGDAGLAGDATPGRDHIIDTPDPNRDNNGSRDSDCDGLSDAEEYGNVYGGGGQTAPDNPDSDGDGLLDGLELGRTSSPDSRCDFFAGDSDPATQTDPTRADTDGDGLADGDEDRNHNGQREPAAELDPRNPDSDGDGLCDGPNDVAPICTGGDPDPFSDVSDRDHDGVPDSVDTAPDNPDRDGDGLCDGAREVPGVCVGGEDLNGDGIVGAGETDPDRVDSDCDGLSDADEIRQGLNPRRRDSDGDLIADGVERGADQNLDATHCAGFVADADPSSQTQADGADSDGDGINDGIEDANQNGRVDPGETDPNNPDSDGDGTCDGPPRAIGGLCTGGEDLNANGVVDPGETDPRSAGNAAPDADSDGIPDSVEDASACLNSQEADSDGDGLNDGAEDSNLNGRFDPGETDPCDIDSDCDGLVDGATYGLYAGESSLGTDPTLADTDGDGLVDGLEAGVTGSAIPPGTNASCGFTADADPQTNTNPSVADSDNDGVPDGAEDANQNGRVDSGELDPLNGADASGPVIAACATASLVSVDQSRDWQPDVQLATARRNANAFSEMLRVDDSSGGSGEAVGFIGFNPATSVAFFALRTTPAGGNAATLESDARARLTPEGALSAAITSQYSTWDGYPAVRGSYHQAGSGGVKARANALLHRFYPSTGTLLDTSADVATSGGFEIRAEYVYRSANTAVVLVALVPTNHYSGDSLFSLEDIAGGSALAQYADGIGVQCDRFASTGYAKVDFLWAVDNSGSMGNDQAAVSAAGTEMGTILNGSTMDWRLAVVTSEYDQDTSASCQNSQSSPCRNFTTDINTFKRWFTSGDAAWVTTSGSPTERTMYGAQLIVRDRFLPSSSASPAPAGKLRRDAYLVVIFLTDAEDQRSGYSSASGRATNIADYTAFFTDYDSGLPGQQTALLGGILCQPGQTSGCDPTEPYSTNPVIHGVINNLGGVIGDLKDTSTIRPTILQILAGVAGATSPYDLSKPAISSTIKVSMAHNSTVGTCNWDDVPRDRSNGFDYDPVRQTLVFYGDCRPDPGQPGSNVVVSYRYWIDRSPDADPPSDGCSCTAPLVCDPVTLDCVCPVDCGEPNLPPEQVCDTASCKLVCRPDCGATCGGNSVCDATPGVCACTCPADCGGPAPSGTFVCDRDPASATFCSYVCNTCPGSPSHPSQTCDPATCTWQCPDCGDCPGLATCSPTSCQCECSQSLSCAAGYTWSDSACDCVCDTAALGCNERQTSDATICACVCLPNCGDACVGNTYCNESLCACLPRGG